jgi:hypothetical protein
MVVSLKLLVRGHRRFLDFGACIAVWVIGIYLDTTAQFGAYLRLDTIYLSMNNKRLQSCKVQG